MTAQDFRIARDRVAGKPPDETAWLAIENIYDELTLPHSSDGRFETLTEGQKAVYVLHWVQSEIRNGGFEQLYFNSTGRFATLAPGAAREVDADEYAAVLARANCLLVAGGEVPEQQGQRRQALHDVLAKRRHELEAIEDDFFTLLGQTDIYELLGRYVLENPQDFFLLLGANGAARRLRATDRSCPGNARPAGVRSTCASAGIDIAGATEPNGELVWQPRDAAEVIRLVTAGGCRVLGLNMERKQPEGGYVEEPLYVSGAEASNDEAAAWALRVLRQESCPRTEGLIHGRRRLPL